MTTTSVSSVCAGHGKPCSLNNRLLPSFALWAHITQPTRYEPVRVADCTYHVGALCTIQYFAQYSSLSGCEVAEIGLVY